MSPRAPVWFSKVSGELPDCDPPICHFSVAGLIRIKTVADVAALGNVRDRGRPWPV